jgi:hypothetical protein
MPYIYRCRQCHASSRPGSRWDAEAYRREHRDVEHGGLIPDGETLTRVPGSAPDPDARYVSSAGIMAVLALLLLASVGVRLFGH